MPAIDWLQNVLFLKNAVFCLKNSLFVTAREVNHHLLAFVFDHFSINNDPPIIPFRSVCTATND